MTVRTALWLAGCFTILVAAAAALAHQHGLLPWPALVAGVGLAAGLMSLALERAVAEPLEAMAASSALLGSTVRKAPARPVGRWVPHEVWRLWRTHKALEEQALRLRLASEGLEARVTQAEREARLLRGAARLLASEDASLEELATWLDDMAELLAVAELWLVPMRRQAPWPVVGRAGVPEGADTLRPRSGAWGELLASGQPRLVCLAPGTVPAGHPLAQATLALFPLFHRGRVQGFLLARLAEEAGGAWPLRYAAVVDAVAPMLAAALYPYRWADGRRLAVEGAALPVPLGQPEA
ncbi:MAG: hypothetical protein VKQ33_13415 [Candidatus Sericytochromatia bacterium]|nr:hypothetical protein [Candidatus Sericytochromatia bacterium]